MLQEPGLQKDWKNLQGPQRTHWKRYSHHQEGRIPHFVICLFTIFSWLFTRKCAWNRLRALCLLGRWPNTRRGWTTHPRSRSKYMLEPQEKAGASALHPHWAFRRGRGPSVLGLDDLRVCFSLRVGLETRGLSTDEKAYKSRPWFVFIFNICINCLPLIVWKASVSRTWSWTFHDGLCYFGVCWNTKRMKLSWLGLLWNSKRSCSQVELQSRALFQLKVPEDQTCCSWVAACSCSAWFRLGILSITTFQTWREIWAPGGQPPMVLIAPLIV